MTISVRNYTESLKAEPTRFRNLTIFPLIEENGSQPDYLTLDEALAQNCAKITEVSEGGSVPELRFVNDGGKRVFLLDGEEVIGAKQNLVFSVSIMAPAGKTIILPVSCKDRPGYWISWIDTQGRRRYRKTDAQNLSQARKARAAELVRVEQAKILGFNPPGEDSFADVADRFLHFQKVRVTAREYAREKLIVERHLKPFFKDKTASIRKVDIDRFVTARSGKVKAATVRREAMTLKYILSKAVEWETIPVTPARNVELPKPPAGRIRYLQPTEFRALIEVCP